MRQNKRGGEIIKLLSLVRLQNNTLCLQALYSQIKVPNSRKILTREFTEHRTVTPYYRYLVIFQSKHVLKTFKSIQMYFNFYSIEYRGGIQLKC